MTSIATEIRWDDLKNTRLLRERGVSFEKVLRNIREGGLLEIREHPNPDRYPGQYIALVEIDRYVFVVPFVVENSVVFLKTIIPSRKETHRLLGG